MADLKNITDFNGNIVLPITHLKAVKDDNGNNLEALLEGKADISDIPDVSELSIPTIDVSSGDLNNLVRYPIVLFTGGYNTVNKPTGGTQNDCGLGGISIAPSVSGYGPFIQICWCSGYSYKGLYMRGGYSQDPHYWGEWKSIY